jgi:hypothetical protein
MRHQAYLFGSLLIAVASSSCSKESTTVSIDTLVPSENAVSGWTFDPAHPAQPVAKTNPEFLDSPPTGIYGTDGGGVPFVDHNFVSFVERWYINSNFGNYDVKLWLFQMPDSATAKQLYDDLRSDPRYERNTHQTTNNWESVSVGEAGRVADTSTAYWLNARKGLYYFEVWLTNKSAENVPVDMKPIVSDFGKAIADKIK